MREADAITFCIEYVRPSWAEEGGLRWLQSCVRDTMNEDGGREHRLSADCGAGILTNPRGDRWRLTAAAKAGSTDPNGHWELVSRARQANERSPFETNTSQFAFLCPAEAARYKLE